MLLDFVGINKGFNFMVLEDILIGFIVKYIIFFDELLM